MVRMAIPDSFNFVIDIIYDFFERLSSLFFNVGKEKAFELNKHKTWMSPKTIFSYLI